MKFYILSEANIDFANCLQYYINEETPQTAERFAETIDRCYDEILESPNLFASDKNGVRRKPVKGFSDHSIEYRIDNDLIEIVAIRHHKRKPDFWEYRL